MEGEVTDFSGNVSSGFNGNAFISVFDKPQVSSTLGNDPSSLITGFQTQTNVLFKGKATVQTENSLLNSKFLKTLITILGTGR
ncbi:MAG: hypothetical protein HC867_05460 [Bacteroidia bacterium]|nr:hypothetical protein [Bacteroidia bacterium]